jgi:anti-anti-sigma factor
VAEVEEGSQMTAVEAQLDVDGDQATVRLAGDIDIEGAPDIVIFATAALNRGGVRSLVIDLSAVTFMDSTGVGALVRARNLCDSHGAELHLHGVGPRVHKVLELTGLTYYFGLPDVDGGRC